MSNSLWPNGLQHARPLCSSPSPRLCPSSCPLHQWCHPAISCSEALFSFCPQFFPALGTFPMSWLFASGDQNTGALASASVFPISLIAQVVKRLSTMRETWVRSLGREDPLKMEMATHSKTLAWKIPWTEKPDGLESIGPQRVGHSWTTSLTYLASASVLPMRIQGWFPLRLTGLSPCCPRDSQEASPVPQFKGINSLELCLLYGPALITVCDYWEDHCLDYMHFCWESDGSAFQHTV